MSLKVNKVILAPMEGVMDPLMRNLLTEINHFDLCITEFVRVVDSLVPKHIFTVSILNCATEDIQNQTRQFVFNY